MTTVSADRAITVAGAVPGDAAVSDLAVASLSLFVGDVDLGVVTPVTTWVLLWYAAVTLASRACTSWSGERPPLCSR
ncbi:hypothetical protein BRC64_06545 [Halobacteriales archaeon QH_10_67_22]|nr:MAG: hypothetical protein BRC64_06545 [Halobacteriales archaeon QH_10_67_22]